MRIPHNLVRTVSTKPTIKVVNGVIGAYCGTQEFERIEDTHKHYKEIINALQKHNIPVAVATHNTQLMNYANSNYNNVSYAMLDPAANFFIHHKQYSPSSAYIVSGNAEHYIKRRIDEISDPSNMSALQERLKESSQILPKTVGYLGEFFIHLKQHSPQLGSVLINVAINLKLLHFMFRTTFTHPVKTVNNLMKNYQSNNITPWLSLTTLEEAQPANYADLKIALSNEYEQYRLISENTQKPFIIGLRTWILKDEDVFELFYNHINHLLKLQNVERIIADWEGPINQQIVLNIYKELPLESKHRFGWTLRALDSTSEFLNQTINQIQEF